MNVYKKASILRQQLTLSYQALSKIMGFWNSIVSFSVATVFPAQLEFMGSGNTYLIYSFFGLLTLLFVWRFVPETKGESLKN